MNRRNMFGRLLGSMVLFGKAVPAAEPMKLMQGEAILRESTHVVNLDMTQASKMINLAMKNARFSLPDGTFTVFPGLTEADDLDTIWTAASSG